MFYERFLQLCDAARIAPSAAATRAGFNRGTVSVWKRKYEAGQDVSPEQDVINKVCAFFGCTESWLRGIPEENEKKPALTEKDELKLKVAAYWGGGDELSKEELDELWDDAESYYKYKLDQMRKRSISKP